MVAVAEVDVERGPREAGARHQGIDREGAEAAAAKQLLGGVENLSLGLFGAPAAADRLRLCDSHDSEKLTLMESLLTECQ